VSEEDAPLPDLGKAPAERAASAVLPAAALVWTAAELMHVTGIPGTRDTAIAAAGAWLVTWGAAGRGKLPAGLPAWTAVTGAWVLAADVLGPLAWWPAVPLTLAWAAIAARAAWVARRHKAVTSAREWREQRADWLGRSREWGLGGSHLLDFQRTRLGELYTVDVKGTGKRRSQILASPVAEVIAQAESLDESQVRLMKHGPAGRIRISVRRVNPWAEPILHPLACDDHEIELPEARSILDEAIVGQDPETGEPLTIPLCDENGAKRVSVTANSGGGKGVLEDNLFEHVTACGDAVAVHLNLSVKGHEDEESWGPACHLTAYGPHQRARAAAILKVIAAVIEWRTMNFKRGQYAPSAEHPAIIIFNDESDSALGALREDIGTIVTKGRSHGVGYVHLGQRNTREYADPKARTQDNVRCTGLVQNSNEARHAGSGTGPDMSTYGEGKPGVWKVELLGGGMSLGRTWIFHRTPAGHGAFVERIAQERAFAQPELSGACREYLGEAYEELLKDEVFARWARGLGAGEPEDEPEDGDRVPEVAAPPAGPPGAGAGTAPSAPAATRKTAVADRDPLEEMWKMDVDEGTRARLDALHEKLGAARQMLEETAAMPKPPQVSKEALAAHTAERWRLIGEEAQIPEGHRERLTAMLAAGTTIGAVAEEFGVTKPVARGWLQKYRNADAAYVDGVKRGARWRLGAPPAGDPAPPESGDAP
jgi:hypothetical protein